MRRSTRGLLVLVGLTGVAWLAACGSSTAPQNVSLAGNYRIGAFTFAGNDVTPAIDSGTLSLTDTRYVVHIALDTSVHGVGPIDDSGTYVATDTGSFGETSDVDGSQVSGTYTRTSTALTVDLTTVIGTVHQVWQQQ